MATYDLKKAIAMASAKRVPFGCYLASKENHLIVASSHPAIAKETEKEAGGALKLSFKGLCFRDGEILVFATAAAPAEARRAMLVKLLKAGHCQNIANVELRQLGPGESEDGLEGAPASTDATSVTNGADGGKTPKLSVQWRIAREAAIAGVGDFISKLRATGDDEAIRASAVVQQLAAGFPTNLDAVIASLERAVASADAGAIAAARGETRKQTTACLEFLKSNERVIGICEGNPFGAPVAISQPLTKVLASINAQLD